MGEDQSLPRRSNFPARKDHLSVGMIMSGYVDVIRNGVAIRRLKKEEKASESEAVFFLDREARG